MGSGIAEVIARAGISTKVVAVGPAAAAGAAGRIRSCLERALERGKGDTAAAVAIKAKLGVTSDLGKLADCDFVVEAALEREDIKLDLHGKIGASLAKEEAILPSIEALYSPPPLLDRMREAGLLGKQSGHRFYAH